MGKLEDYCEQEQIKLYVLPPRSPKINCYVERANETRKLLRKFEYKYNCERMHQSLDYLTLMEYYYKLKEKCA